MTASSERHKPNLGRFSNCCLCWITGWCNAFGGKGHLSPSTYMSLDIPDWLMLERGRENYTPLTLSPSPILLSYPGWLLYLQNSNWWSMDNSANAFVAPFRSPKPWWRNYSSWNHRHWCKLDMMMKYFCDVAFWYRGPPLRPNTGVTSRRHQGLPAFWDSAIIKKICISCYF